MLQPGATPPVAVVAIDGARVADKDNKRIRRLITQLFGLRLTYLTSCALVVAASASCVYFAVHLSPNNTGTTLLIIFLYMITMFWIGISSNMLHRLNESEEPDLTVGERSALRNETKYRVVVALGLLVCVVASVWVTLVVDSSGTLIGYELWLATATVLYAVLSRQRANASTHLKELQVSPERYAIFGRCCPVGGGPVDDDH